MAKSKKGFGKFWQSDWFVASVPALFLVWLASIAGVFVAVENAVYDSAVVNPSLKPSEEIVLVTIDEVSLESVGRWPWPRQKQAELIDAIAAAKPKVIAPTMFYMEPQNDAGLEYIQKMKAALAADTAPAAASVEAQKIADEAQAALDGDTKLASSIKKAGNVLLATPARLGDPVKRPDGPITGNVVKSFVSVKGVPSVAVQELPLVLPKLGDESIGVAPIGLFDQSGATKRDDATLFEFFGNPIMPFTLAVTAAQKGLNAADVRADAEGTQLLVGNLKVPLSEGIGTHRPIFYSSGDGKVAFANVSAIDVMTGKVPAGRLAGKAVIVGTDVAGVGGAIETPAGPMFPSAFLANGVSAALQGHHVTTGMWWGTMSILLAVVLILAYLVFVSSRLSAGTTNVVAAIGVVALLSLPYLLLRFGLIWLPLFMPAMLLLTGHLVATSKRFFVTEKGKLQSDAESAETNRMMGLAYQGQGQLDMAFDRFRRVPLNEQQGVAAMENMYNLALDFERKRQFNKAQAVYEYMAGYDKDFKDLKIKLERAKNLSETVILGGGSAHPGGTLILGDGTVEKPMLGRFEVEKELGKGAMGVVYLGKDPKIGRVVAIKTMALSNEFEGEELVDAKERFFREAETAGRLQHPNIVTIYDIGEAHDLAYIAMEFLRGKDLADQTKPGALLAPALVLSICARVAQALAYAHKQAVVHRDIKPANIMYDMEADNVKVTDFGIARITDSSKTKTGLVLGTPSFMSPEQIAGKRVDGRSDLYSLGVMVFQMLTGVLPFRGESMAELMYKIANEEAADIRTLRPEYPESVAHVVALALAKRPEVRYQDGDQMAADLLAAATALGGASFAPANTAAGFAASMGMATAAVAGQVDANAATQVMQAGAVAVSDEKTVVMSQGAGASAAEDKTQVMPRQAAPDDASAKTQVMPRAAEKADSATLPAPFEKTVVAARPANIDNPGKPN